MEKFSRKEINQFKKAIQKERLELFKKEEWDIPRPKGKILTARDIYVMHLRENPRN